MTKQDNTGKYTKEKYRELLDKTISYYKSKEPNPYILNQLLDIKKYIVEQRIYQCMNEDLIWEECNQKYSIGAYAVRELEEGSKKYEALTTLYGGAIEYESLPDNENNKDLVLRKTYLNDNVKDGFLTRWQTNHIPVYIPPIENIKYKDAIINAFTLWSDATNKNLTFEYVNEITNSGINITFRDDDKIEAGGYFENNYTDNNQISSSKLEICLPRPQLTSQSDDEIFNELILSLIGCLLGLPNSPYIDDVTCIHREERYTSGLSVRDKLSIKWLYSIPKDISIRDFAVSKGLNSDFSIDDIIARLDNTIIDEYGFEEDVEEIVVSTPEATVSKTNLFFRILMCIALFFTSIWAWQVNVKNRLVKMKNRIHSMQIREQNDVENVKIKRENPYAVYDDMLTQKELLDANAAESMVESIDGLLNLNDEGQIVLEEEDKTYLEQKKVEFIKLAIEKGSNKY